MAQALRSSLLFTRAVQKPLHIYNCIIINGRLGGERQRVEDTQTRSQRQSWGGSRLAALSPFLQLENSHTREALEFERSPAGEDRSLLLEKGTRRPAGTGCLQ